MSLRYRTFLLVQDSNPLQSAVLSGFELTEEYNAGWYGKATVTVDLAGSTGAGSGTPPGSGGGTTPPSGGTPGGDDDDTAQDVTVGDMFKVMLDKDMEPGSPVTLYLVYAPLRSTSGSGGAGGGAGSAGTGDGMATHSGTGGSAGMATHAGTGGRAGSTGSDLSGAIIRAWPCVVTALAPSAGGSSTKASCLVALADPITYLSGRPIWGVYRACSIGAMVGGALSLAAGGDGKPTLRPILAGLPQVRIVENCRDAVKNLPYSIASGEPLGHWLSTMLGILGLRMEMYGGANGVVYVNLTDQVPRGEIPMAVVEGIGGVSDASGFSGRHQRRGHRDQRHAPRRLCRQRLFAAAGARRRARRPRSGLVSLLRPRRHRQRPHGRRNRHRGNRQAHPVPDGDRERRDGHADHRLRRAQFPSWAEDPIRHRLPRPGPLADRQRDPQRLGHRLLELRDRVQWNGGLASTAAGGAAAAHRFGHRRWRQQRLQVPRAGASGSHRAHSGVDLLRADAHRRRGGDARRRRHGQRPADHARGLQPDADRRLHGQRDRLGSGRDEVPERRTGRPLRRPTRRRSHRRRTRQPPKAGGEAARTSSATSPTSAPSGETPWTGTKTDSSRRATRASPPSSPTCWTIRPSGRNWKTSGGRFAPAPTTRR